MYVILTASQDDNHHHHRLAYPKSEEVTMKALVQLAIATTVLASAIAASAQSLTEADVPPNC